MSPTVTLSDETFAKLQAIAKPFVDTPESVISTLADAELRRRSASGEGNGRGVSGTTELLRLNADTPENLTHTRLLSATVDGRPIHRPKWNTVMNHLHVLGLERLGSFDALRRATAANIREGRYEENGFRYLPEADFSIQGADANIAWANSLRMARALRVPVELKLEWRQKDGAVRPGETALLQWAP